MLVWAAGLIAIAAGAVDETKKSRGRPKAVIDTTGQRPEAVAVPSR